VLPIAIGTMVVFSLFVQMSEGATFSVVPFINKKALGSVAGIVGAGGNAGAVAAGFLFRSEDLTWPQALLILGVVVFLVSFAAYAVKFTAEAEAEAKIEFDKALEERRRLAKEAKAAKPAIQLPSLPGLLKDLTAMDLLRIYLGAALALKGVDFILNMQHFESVAGGLGSFQNVAAWYVVAAHTVGGAALMVGIATRVAAFFNITVLVGAVLVVTSSEGLFAPSQALELSLLTLFALLLFLWQGAGKVSFDGIMRVQPAAEPGPAN